MRAGRGSETSSLNKATDTQTLLYTNEIIEGAIKIWREFENARKEIRERNGGSEEREIMGELER